MRKISSYLIIIFLLTTLSLIIILATVGIETKKFNNALRYLSSKDTNLDKIISIINPQINRKYEDDFSSLVKIIIRECLLHLPRELYPDDEVDLKTLDVYRHIHSNYYGGGASIYNTTKI